MRKHLVSTDQWQGLWATEAQITHHFNNSKNPPPSSEHNWPSALVGALHNAIMFPGYY